MYNDSFADMMLNERKLSEKMKANPTLEKNVNKVLSFGPDILLAVPRALLTSKLSGYVNKALFGKKKDASPAPTSSSSCSSSRISTSRFR